VVVFSQRQTGEAWERQVEAEQTEVEPERNAQIWPGWEARPICDWMVEQLGQGGGAESTADGPADKGAEADEVDEGGEAAQGAEDAVAAPRPALRIDGVTIDDAGRVAYTVSGAPSATPLLAVARVRRRDGPGWNVADPVAVPGSGQVEFDLTAVPAGEDDVRLIAWAPDVSAEPVSVPVPPHWRLRARGGR
jgi:hypothetical protein